MSSTLTPRNWQFGRREILALILCIAIGSIHAWSVHRRFGLRGDEVSTAQWVSGSYSELLAGTQADVHPPFYFTLVFLVYRLTDGSLFALRLCSVIAWAGTLPLLLRLTHRLVPNQRATNSLTILFLTSPFLLQYSSEIRYYSLSAFLFTLGLVAFASDSKRRSVTYVGLGSLVLLAWTAYLPAIVLAVLFIVK